jgi:hypothetical protein
MTEYHFHSWPSGTTGKLTPRASLEAESRLHGAALALRQFVMQGCDISAPGADVDITDPAGVKHTVLVEEVLDWPEAPEQTTFVQRERLATLL